MGDTQAMTEHAENVTAVSGPIAELVLDDWERV